MSPVSAYLLYAVLAVGGVALYLMLPRGRESRSLAGGVLGLAALAMLVALLASNLAPPSGSSVFFYLFAMIAVASAARVITHRKPVYCALHFVLTVISVAALVVLERAEFVAIALVIIYAGAILVTYLFVIMLAQAPGSPVYDHQAREPLVTVFACFLLMAAIVTKAAEWDATSDVGASAAMADLTHLAEDALSSEAGSGQPMPDGNTLAVGWTVMTRFVVALELAAILLLVSMVGAIALSQRRVEPEVPRMPAEPLGQIGKEVPPF